MIKVVTDQNSAPLHTMKEGIATHQGSFMQNFMAGSKQASESKGMNDFRNIDCNAFVI